MDLIPYVPLVWLAVLTVGNLVAFLRRPGADAAAALEAFKTQVAERDKSTREEFESILADHTQRLTEIGVHMQHIPSVEQLRAIERALSGMEERTRMMGDSLRRIEDYLRQTKE